MIFRRSKEKEMKMIWKVNKNNHRSYLVGTAHFFPYSFKTSLSRYIETAQTVIFEGPLDEESMAKVVEAGCLEDKKFSLFSELDSRTVSRITEALLPSCRNKNLLYTLNFQTGRMENPINDLIKGMKPWLAFFTIWSRYLKRNGWSYSVDLEGYVIASELGKHIVFLETIEEQIKVLESLSYDRIFEFLKQVDSWDKFSQEYLKCYLDGNLSKLKSMRLGFPSRHHSIINHRDDIFYERMVPYLKQGDVIAFVGAPHVRGLSRMLKESGYQIEGPEIS